MKIIQYYLHTSLHIKVVNFGICLLLKVLTKVRKNRQDRLNAKVGSYLRLGSTKINDVNLDLNKNTFMGRNLVNSDAQDKFNLNENHSSFNYPKSGYQLVS